ncbi:MAG: DUF456 domain-containing protein [Spirochaetes bacterium]|nr:DUF456 domain-containing protein [Spirochaetota bacterium]
MDYLLAVIGGLLILVAFIGCFVPIIPGPPLGFAGLLCVHFTRWGGYEFKVLIGIGSAVVIAAILDYLLPLWSAKKFGGSKRGVFGATLGMIVGLLLFSPWGVIVGPLVGAFVGEYSNKGTRKNSLKSAFGVFLGIIFSLWIKLAVMGLITYYYVIKLFFS